MKLVLLITGMVSLPFLMFCQPAIQWQKNYGGTFTDYNNRSVAVTGDGGYILAGGITNNADFHFPSSLAFGNASLVKFTAAGIVQWKHTYGGSRYDIFNSVQQTTDGGYIALGSSSSTDGDVVPGGNIYYASIWLVKTDASGNIVWQKALGTLLYSCYGNSVQQTTDGGYIITGIEGAPADKNGQQVALIKVDATGNTTWEKVYGGESADFGNSVRQTADGGFIIAGLTSSNSGDVVGNHTTGLSGTADVWVVKFTTAGLIEWQKCLGGLGAEQGMYIQNTSDAGYIVAGYTSSTDGDVTGVKGSNDAWIVKLGSTGTIQWQKTYGGASSESANSIQQTTDGGYIFGCGSSSNDGDVTGHHGAAGVSDAWVVKINATGTIQWQRAVGANGSDGAVDVKQTATGYISTGTYRSRGYLVGDRYIVKYDNAGNVLSEDFAVASGGKNMARSIELTTDGGYVVAGSISSTDGDISGNHFGTDGWVIKTDNNGVIQWQKPLGGSGEDYATSIKKTSDGGYIVTGNSNSIDGDVTVNHGGTDYWVVKLSSAGNIQWQKSFGGTGIDSATSVQQTTDGGYVVMGRTTSTDGDVTGNHGSTDYWLLKLDASGNLVWQKALGGTDSDVGLAVQQTSEGGYVVIGYSASTDGNITGNHGGNDCWVVKLDEVGNITWQKALGGTKSDIAYSVRQTTDGGYIIAGTSNSNDGDVSGNHPKMNVTPTSYGSDFWIVKLNGTGNIVWQKCLGSSDDETAFSAQQTSDGGYIVSGRTSDFSSVPGFTGDGDVSGINGDTDYWIVKLNSAGSLVWQKALGGTSYEVANAVQQATDGGYIIAGYTYSNDGDVTGNIGAENFWVVKFAAETLPVTLLDFDGYLQNSNVILKWRTASEINNKGFQVQKSTDGQTFGDIGFVHGKGTSSVVNNYTYDDPKLTSGSNYYRLKQVDLDEKYTYSAVIKIDYSKFAWSVENPVTDNSWIQLQLDKTANVSLQVITVNGNIIQTINKGIIEKGTYSIPLNLAKKVPGVYVVKLLVDDKKYFKKIVKTQ